MIVVIQCASKKRTTAGYLRRRDGGKVLFVADPLTAPTSNTYTYARPDDTSDEGRSWRDKLIQYNHSPENNPLDLLPSYQLYENSTYRLLAQHFGAERLFILSAGWGLITAQFLTPMYDITFSKSADSFKRRHRNHAYRDFCMLPTHNTEPIVFLGGKDYFDLFCQLSRASGGQKFVFYNSQAAPEIHDCTLMRFNTNTRTNWHYECARALVEGKIRFSESEV